MKARAQQKPAPQQLPASMYRLSILFACLCALWLAACRERTGCEALLDYRDGEYIDRVNDLIEAGELAAAIRLNDEALRYNPRNYMALSNRGALRFEQKRHYLTRDELSCVLNDLEGALLICPNYVIGTNNLMTIGAEFGLFNQVINAAKLRDSLVGGLSTYHRTKLLIAYYHSGYDTLAIRVGESVLRDAPAYTDAANYLALTYVRQRQYPRGQSLLEGVVKDGRADALTYYALGELHRTQEHFLLAGFYYNESVRLDPKHYDAILALARLRERQENYSEACSNYQLAEANCRGIFGYRYEQAAVRRKIETLCGPG